MSLPRVARNTLVQFAGRGVSTLFGVFALAAATRYLGQEQYGWYTTVTTFLQFFGILSDFGLTLITAQMLSEPNVDESKTISNIFTFRLILSGFFFGASIISIWFFPYPATIKWGVLVYIIAPYAVTLQNIFMGLFQRHLRMDRVAWGDVLGRGIVLIGFLWCIHYNWGFLPILAVSVIANVGQLALLWFYSRPISKVHLAFDMKVWKDIFYRSWPVAISIAFNLIYLKADTVILSLMRPQTEVGLYGASYRMVDVLSSVPMMFMGIMLPMLSAAWLKHDEAQFQHFCRRAFDFMSLLALPMLFGGVYLAKPLMAFLAGEDFRESGIFLRILFFALAAIFFGVIFSHAVIALKKQRQAIWFYLIDAALSLAGYLIFIPRFGGVGAAWVTVFSEVFIALATAWIVFRASHFRLSWNIFVKSVGACLVMLAGLQLMANWHILFICAGAGVIYIFTMFLMKGITKQMVLEIVKGK